MATLLHASAEWRDRYDISLALLDREDAAYAPPRWVDTIQFDCHGRLLPSVWAIRRLISRLQPDATLSFLTRANFAHVAATAGQKTACILSGRVNTSAHLNEGAGAMLGKMLVPATYPRPEPVIAVRSAGSRVGGACGSSCRSRGWPHHSKKK